MRPNTTYRASFYAKTGAAGGPLTVSLQNNEGKIMAQASIKGVSGTWQKYSVILMTGTGITPSASNHFVITATQPGTYRFNLVSLFRPPTTAVPTATGLT